MTITLTLTVAQLAALPGDAVIKLIRQASPPRSFIEACYQHERATQARWVLLNHLRTLLKTLPAES